MAIIQNYYKISARNLNNPSKNVNWSEYDMKSTKNMMKKYLKLLDITLRLQEKKKFDKEKIQKFKFTLISELISTLFNHKNCKDHYTNISNLIITFLTALETNNPIDMYTEYHEMKSKELDYDRKNILKEEFNLYTEESNLDYFV